MAFPSTPMGFTVEMAFGADPDDSGTWVWTDITQWVYGQDPIQIQRGWQDERSSATASTMSLMLNNRDGRWNPFLATGPWYGQFGLDSPVRVTIDPGVAVNNNVRFTGYVSDLSPSWDAAPDDCRIVLHASSVMRRAELSRQVATPLTRFLRTQGPIALWPLEDADGSTSAAAGLPTHREMAASSSDVVFGKIEGPAGAANGPQFLAAASLTGVVPYTASTTWTFVFHIKAVLADPAGPSGDFLFATVRTGGTVRNWELRLAHLNIVVTAYDADGTQIQQLVKTVPGITSPSTLFNGEWHTFAVTFSPVGSDIQVLARVDDVAYTVGTVTSRTSYPVQSVQLRNQPTPTYVDNVADVGFGAVAVFDSAWAGSGNVWEAMNGFLGEDASTRFLRLCGEEGLVGNVNTGTTPHQTMGVQSTAKFMDLIREIEAADGGVVVDSLGGYMTYMSRSYLTQKATDDTLIWGTLSIPDGDVFLPFAPMLDDQQIVNDVTASRPGGSSARYRNVGTTQGTYEDSVTVNIDRDDGLLSQAAWRVWKTAQVDYRYPQVTVNFTGNPGLVSKFLSAPGGMGGRFKVKTQGFLGLAPDELDLLTVGYTELIGQFPYSVTVNTIPARAFRFGVMDSAMYGRADTESSILTSGITATATTMSVTTVAGPIWLTTATLPAQFPLTIRVGGEDMSVTAISGSSSPQTFTVVRGVNGVNKPHSAGEAVSLRYPMVMGV